MIRKVKETFSDIISTLQVWLSQLLNSRSYGVGGGGGGGERSPPGVEDQKKPGLNRIKLELNSCQKNSSITTL